MTEIKNYDSTTDVARASAEHAITTLRSAIEARGRATWVIAGGSSPIEAYKLIVDEFSNALDWSRVIVMIGDERIVPFTDNDSNWGQIRDILFNAGPTSALCLIPPPVSGSAEDAADKYERNLKDILRISPRLDLVWLGVGPDGHTLSLAPDRPDLITTDRLVIPVHDFPKPPSDRISFTLTALAHTASAVVFATSDSKRDVLKRALAGEHLPIRLASDTIEDNGGTATWLFDTTARS